MSRFWKLSGVVLAALLLALGTATTGCGDGGGTLASPPEVRQDAGHDHAVADSTLPDTAADVASDGRPEDGSTEATADVVLDAMLDGADGSPIDAGSDAADLDAGDARDRDAPDRDAGGGDVAPTPACGDGRIDAGETCDDGRPPATGDGCDAQCQVEPGYDCNVLVRPSECTRRHGDSCRDPFSVSSLPFSTSGTTANAADDVSSIRCPSTPFAIGSQAPDTIYAFTPQQTGLYTITLHARESYDAALYLVTDCESEGASCVAASDEFQTANETLRIRLTAGQTYYLIVDGGAPGAPGGAYDLDISAPCVADCTGKVCGDDGCGGSCGSCVSGVCTSGQCVGPRGDRCADPLVIDSLPFSQSNDSTTFSNDYSTTSAACPGNARAVGAAGRDVVYSFTPTTTGHYKIQVTENGWDSALYVATDCASIGTSCLAGADVGATGRGEKLDLLLVAGTEYFIFVDGWSNTVDVKGPYSIQVSVGCTPDCAGKVCGSDGCGGSCGSCSAGYCSQGQCGPPPPGDTCPNAFPVTSLPFTDHRDSRDFFNQYYHLANVCPGNPLGAGAGSPEVVYTFTPATSGIYQIAVSETGWDSAIYVATDCAGVISNCLAGSDDFASGQGETLSIRLEAGQQYFIFVDGFSQTTSVAGPFDIELTLACVPDCTQSPCGNDGCGGSCNACTSGVCIDGQCTQPPHGDTCEDPFVIGAVPFAENGDSRGFGNQYSHPADSCPGNPAAVGAGSRDLVYAFTPAATGIYAIDVHETGWDSTVYVTTDCSSFAASCVAGADNGSTGEGETLSVSLDAGTTYFIVVDGWENSADVAGPYSIEISAACTPDCAGKSCGDGDGCGGQCGGCEVGDTCENPFVIGLLPYAQDGDTTPLHQQYSHDAGFCPGDPTAVGAGSRDAVYAFTPPATGRYEVQVQEDAWDSAIYIATDCAHVSQSCVAGSDSGFEGFGETITATLEGGTQYFIFVDGWNNSASVHGPFSISVTAR